MHRLVVGETGCGKSRMLREIIIPEWIRRGHPVCVLDPLSQPWRATYQTTDPHDWLDTLRRSKGCIGVWDECGNMCEEEPALKRELNYAATVSRNDGHLVYFVGQRLYQIPPTFRNQCSWSYLFRLRGRRDVQEAADLFPDQGVAESLPGLDYGECFLLRPFKKPVKTRIF
jgi:hypothetical protein